MILKQICKINILAHDTGAENVMKKIIFQKIDQIFHDHAR